MNSQKKLLILGTNGNIANTEAVECAKSMGIYTIVTDYNPPEKSPAKLISDEYWMISTTDYDALEKKCREVGVNGIFGGTDFAIDVAIELSKRLGISYYCDEDTWKFSRDKAAFKQKCKEYGVPVAKDFYVSEIPTEQEISKIEFPVVVKPIDKSGNLGLSYVYSPDEFMDAYNNAKTMSPSGKIVIEKMLTGIEYDAFYVMAKGKIRLLNLWTMLSEPEMPNNCYSMNVSFAEGLEDYLNNVNPQVISLLKGIGCRDGVGWIELMKDESGKFCALEMGHRISGEMMWIPLTQIRGFDSLKWVVNYCVNESNDPQQLVENQNGPLKGCACGYILWTKQAGKISKVTGKELISSAEGMYLHMISDVGDEVSPYRYGAIITLAVTDCDELNKKIEWINENFHMLDENGKDLLIYYDQFNYLKSLEKSMNV